MSRLTAEFWIAAYRARLAAAGLHVYIARRGDATAGTVVVKIATLDGRARLMGRTWDAEGARVWATLAEGPEAEVDAAAAWQARADPDLWLIEVEDRAGGALLDEPGLRD